MAMSMSIPCQGLPDRPCPRLKCDDTVHNTIYDLFLCVECERMREQTNKKQGSAVTKDTLNTSCASGTARPVTRAAERAKRGCAVANTRVSNKGKSDQASSAVNSPIVKDAVVKPVVKPALKTGRLKTSVDTKSDAEDHDDITCPQCLLTLSGEASLKCDVCNLSFHSQCAHLTKSAYNQLVKLLPVIGWVCQDCKTMARSLCARLQSSVSELADKFTQLQADMMKLSQQMKPAVQQESAAASGYTDQNEQQLDNDVISTVVYRAVKDISRRKRNVIVTGIPESDNITDREAFTQLCSSHLTIKPFVEDRNCKRIGKSSPRRLLVKLRSEAAAAELLSAAHRLRHADPYTAEHVYINADLTRAEAAAAYEARKERRSKKSQARSPLQAASAVAAGEDEEILPSTLTAKHVGACSDDIDVQEQLTDTDDKSSSRKSSNGDACTVAVEPVAASGLSTKRSVSALSSVTRQADCSRSSFQ